MKAEIHPKFYPEAKVSCSCGAVWATGSTIPEIRTDICSSCHPFYTGEQRIVDTAGQVERFMTRLKQFDTYQSTQAKRTAKQIERVKKAFLKQQLIALDLSDELFDTLSNADYITIGDVIEGLDVGKESMLALKDVTEKTLNELRGKVESARATFEASNLN